MLSKHPTEFIEARRLSEASMNGNTQRIVEGIKQLFIFRRGKYTFRNMVKPNFERVHVFDMTNLSASPIEIRLKNLFASKLNRIHTAVITG